VRYKSNVTPSKGARERNSHPIPENEELLAKQQGVATSEVAPATGGPIIAHTYKEVEIQRAIGWFAAYLNTERENYYPLGHALRAEWRSVMDGYFEPALLDQVRVVELLDRRLENPWFYPQAKKHGIRHLPDMTHKAAVTLLDVIVFNGKIESRDLFHGLVHAAQVKVLGASEFTDLFVRGFLTARSYFLAPLKAHAFGLDARFAANPGVRFSVEKEIRDFWRRGKY
jgi:hypothetical protein